MATTLDRLSFPRGTARNMFVFACLVMAGITVQPTSAETAANRQSALGVNLQEVSYYSSEIPFLNVFKMGGGWITQSSGTWDTDEEQYLNLDDNGYPTSLTAVNDPNRPQRFTSVAVVLLHNLPRTANGYYPGGRYVVRYDGQGTLTYSFDARLVRHSSGRDVINVTPSSNGILIKITSTDPRRDGDYIRNIRIVQARYESALNNGQVFNPVFLRDLKNFRAIRFMDWLRTNNSSLSSWRDRPVPSDAFWGTGKGVPLEVCIELANAISADAWLNIPVKASDDYVMKTARLVDAELGPTQRVYVELSNEVWNRVFRQNAYSIAQGMALFPSAANRWYASWEWYGMRVAQVADLWYSVYGSAAFRSRVVVVMAGQTVNPSVLREELSTPDWKGGGNGPAVNHHIGAVSVESYFSATPSASDMTRMLKTADGGLRELYDQLMSTRPDNQSVTGGDEADYFRWIRANARLAASYGLPLIAYEGGQDLSGAPNFAANSAPVKLFFALNTSPLMATIYSTYLNDWKNAGGTLFMVYNDTSAMSQYGEWGLLESVMQATEPLSAAPPKWRAVQGFIKSTRCWWSNCTGAVTGRLRRR